MDGVHIKMKMFEAFTEEQRAEPAIYLKGKSVKLEIFAKDRIIRTGHRVKRYIGNEIFDFKDWNDFDDRMKRMKTWDIFANASTKFTSVLTEMPRKQPQ